MKSRKVIKILSVAIFIFMIMQITYVLADVGDFDSYDSGSDWNSGGSSWDSSSDDWSSSSYSGRHGKYNAFTDPNSVWNTPEGAKILPIIVIGTFVIIVGGGMLIFTLTHTDVNYNPIKEKKVKNIKTNIIINDFNEEEFLTFVGDLFVKMQYAWSKRNFEEIRPYETKELYEQHSTQLAQYVINNKINVMQDVIVNMVKIDGYNFDKQNEKLIVHLYASMRDFIIDSNTGELLEGDNTRTRDRAYKLTFIRNRERNKEEMNCPNCGAIIEVNSSKKCEACGALIVNDNNNKWLLSSLEPLKR